MNIDVEEMIPESPNLSKSLIKRALFIKYYSYFFYIFIEIKLKWKKMQSINCSLHKKKNNVSYGLITHSVQFFFNKSARRKTSCQDTAVDVPYSRTS